MIIKLAPLIFPARCLLQCQSFQCSNLKLLNYSKKRMRKSVLLMRQCRDSIRDYRPQRLQSQSGRRLRETVSDRLRIAMSAYSARCSNLNFPRLVSRLQLFQDQTPTCLRIFVSSSLPYHYLEIPRPYGSFAPFMPSEPGSAMRHIIKPKIREIEY